MGAGGAGNLACKFWGNLVVYWLGQGWGMVGAQGMVGARLGFGWGKVGAWLEQKTE